MKFGSSFSGIGAFDLGFERAGMTCVWQVEIDTRCQSVLGRHWPDVKRYGDVHDVGKHNLEPVDLVCGGFPCQDLSIAGQRAGLAGERSGLWFEFHRILTGLKPRWVVIENVPGLLSSNGGRDFAILLGGLTGILPQVPRGGWGNAGFARGPVYGVAYRVLDAQFYGVPQRRRRVFIVASFGSGCAAQVLFERTGSAWDPPPSRETGQRVARPLANSTTIDHYDESQQSYIVAGQCHGSNVGPMGELRRGNGGVTGGVPFVAQPLSAHRCPRYNGSEDALVAFQPRYYTRDNKPGGQPSEIADITNCHKAGDSAPHVMAFQPRYARNGRGAPDIIAAPLTAEAGRTGKGDSAQCVAISPPLRCEGHDASEDGRGRRALVPSAMGVRRLTPTECERLQGFPDGWTAGQSDSARYRQLGNAVCVPVAEWIGKRIMTLPPSCLNQAPNHPLGAVGTRGGMCGITPTTRGSVPMSHNKPYET